MNRKKLKDLIQSGQTDRATKMVRSAKDFLEGEWFVFTVLRDEKSAPELVEAVLEAFLGTRENRYNQHGNWVHSLSHFNFALWERRMVDWIKKLNKVAFKGANELHDTNCSSRLVNDFVRFAKFYDDPADFGLTLANLQWMDWKYAVYAKARIEAGRFKSEEAFLRWKLHRHEAHIVFDYDAQTNLVNLDGIRSLVQQLQELGTDTSEFNGLERDLLTKQLSELKKRLLVAQLNSQREFLKKGIQKTRAALAALD